MLPKNGAECRTFNVFILFSIRSLDFHKGRWDFQNGLVKWKQEVELIFILFYFFLGNLSGTENENKWTEGQLVKDVGLCLVQHDAISSLAKT